MRQYTALVPQKPLFSGKHQPAADAVMIESLDTSGVMPWISRIGFVVFAIVLGVVTISVSDVHIKPFTAAFAAVCLLLAIFSHMRAKKNKLASMGSPSKTVAMDGYGVWWSDREQRGRIAWENLVAAGVGLGFETTGGVIGTTPTLRTLELFPANTHQATDQSSRAGDPRFEGQPPKPGMPSARLRFELDKTTVPQVEQAIARLAHHLWIGEFHLGVVNTLTGGIHPPKMPKE